MPTALARVLATPDGFARAEATFSDLVGQLQSGDTARMSHSALETFLEREGRELMRQLQAHLDAQVQATVDAPVVGGDGVERTPAA